jgi:hypothetical protein
MKQEQCHLGVGVLVIGQLPKFSEISFESLRNTGISKICFIADSEGKKWILDKGANPGNIRLCEHKNLRINAEIGKLGKSSMYVNFGEKKFYMLMILKWLLILDMWNQHRDMKVVLFSDLDVYWKRAPKIEEIFPSESDAFLAIQDDSRGDSRKYYCPGIMFWRRSQDSKKTIENIFRFQRSEILKGRIIADDKALNMYLKEKNLYRRIIALESTEFIIGHRFPYLMLGIKGYRFRKFNAFHANYTKGEKNKLKYLQIVSKKTFNLQRYLYLSWFLWNRLFSKF